MAQANLGGFSNQKFVMINSAHWDNKKRRRNIHGYMWIAEFAEDVLLKAILQTNHNPHFFNEFKNTWMSLQDGGPLEIIKYLIKKPSTLFVNLNSKRMSLNIYNHIRIIRNKLIHEHSIGFSTLEDLLGKMIQFCTLYVNICSTKRDYIKLIH